MIKTLFNMTSEELRRWIERLGEDPLCCTYCGATAGVCINYPNCPGGPTVNREFENASKGLTEGSTKSNVKAVSDSPRPAGGPPAPQSVPVNREFEDAKRRAKAGNATLGDMVAITRGDPNPPTVPIRVGAEGCMTPLPRYQCHKKVWALKIADIHDPSTNKDEVWLITPEDNYYASFVVSDAYIKKHEPKVGGYWVQYEGGYQSFSPATEFEAGYTRL